jgi:hypothetical protein
MATTTRQRTAGQRILNLCGAEDAQTGRYCTRKDGHQGNHIAAVGPYEPGMPVIAEWPDHAPWRNGPRNRQSHD